MLETGKKFCKKPLLSTEGSVVQLLHMQETLFIMPGVCLAKPHPEHECCSMNLEAFKILKPKLYNLE